MCEILLNRMPYESKNEIESESKWLEGRLNNEKKKKIEKIMHNVCLFWFIRGINGALGIGVAVA